MKNKILIIIIALIFYATNYTYAITQDMIEEQKNNFGISSFVKEADTYADDFFEESSISDILNSAIKGKVDNSSILKKILSIFGKEILDSLKVFASLLVIIIIHSILKSISDSLESNNVSQIIYYVQYILIVTVITANFAEIVQMVKDTADKLVGFMNCLVPLLISLMLFTGSIVTSSVIEPVILFMINIIGNSINLILIPVVLIITVLSIVSKISDQIQIDKLSKLLNSGVIWTLGIVLTLFVATISLEGSLSSSVDGISAKTAKAAVSTVIPVVGKILGDAVDSVLGCGVILKNAVGTVGVIIVICICVTPIIKLRYSYHLL